ncbi:MAG: ABC transporter ATP-binding protein [Bacteroidota bacterium]
MSNDNRHIVLSTHNLEVGYTQGDRTTTVLSNVDLSLKSGELVCFMGPNGVGKSTLIRTLTAVQPTLKGQVTLLGNDLTRLSMTDIALKVSMVLTDNTNAGNLTAEEIVALGRYPYLSWNLSFKADDYNKIDEAIKRTNIGKFRHKRIYELSDGQVQKVMIARALCQDTPIMILDEPTAHLDLNNRVEIINLLKDLTRSTNKAVLMATHELDLALQSADRLWLAGYERPIQEGFPEDLVLSGKIDDVFELKGFDLKTGHLYKKSLGMKIRLIGEGYHYLWTKNALERNGYEIDDSAGKHIRIQTLNNTTHWRLNEDKQVNSLEELIRQLELDG